MASNPPFARRVSKRIALAAWAAVIVSACMACSGQSSTSAAPVATPTPSSAADLNYPLDAYQLTTTQTAEVEYLQTTIEKSCMAKLGFADFMPTIPASYVAQEAKIFQEFNSRIWGISDPVQAALYGYHLPPWAQATPGSEGTRTLASLPVAEQVVLVGRGGSGGCLGEAKKDVAALGLGSGDQTATLIANLQNESFNRAKADSRVQHVFAAWSACMKSSGYDYSSPFTVPNFTASPSPTQAEIQTAKTDVACKYKVNLLGVTYAVESDYQNQFIDQNPTALAQIQAEVKSEQKALAAAAAKYGV